MKDIPGTERITFKVIFNEDFFKQGDVLSCIGPNTEVLNKKPEQGYRKEGIYTYTLCTELEGEELKIAIEHYNFLRKYNLA